MLGLWVALAVTVLTFLGGVALWVSMLVGSLLAGFVQFGLSPSSIAGMLVAPVKSWLMLAMPFFVVGGNLLAEGGSTESIFEFLDSLVGRIRGSLPISVAFCGAILGAMTGSTLASEAALNATAYPRLLAQGYDKRYSAALIAATGILAPIIPPSVYMIMYADLVGESVPTLFMAGFIPGLLMTVGVAFVAVLKAPKSIAAAKKSYTWKERGDRFLRSLPGLGAIAVIFVTIYGGIATPTEAASAGAVWAFLIGFFVYKGFRRDRTALKRALLNSARTIFMLYVLIASACMFGKVITFGGLPQAITKFVTAGGVSITMYVALVIICLCILGCLMDGIAILYVTVPLLTPALFAAGYNPVHYGIVLTTALILGQLTPPFGLAVFGIAGMTKVPTAQVFTKIWPYIIVFFLAVWMVLLFPELSMYLPRIMGLPGV